MQLHVQKNDVQLARMTAVPVQQGFSGRKFKELSLHLPLLQDALKQGPERKARIRQIITDSDSQHMHHSLSRSSAPLAAARPCLDNKASLTRKKSCLLYHKGRFTHNQI